MSDGEILDDVEQSPEMKEAAKRKKSRDETAAEISSISDEWRFLLNQVMMHVGDNDRMKSMMLNMMGAALVEALAVVVADRLDIELAIGHDDE